MHFEEFEKRIEALVRVTPARIDSNCAFVWIVIHHTNFQLIVARAFDVIALVDDLANLVADVIRVDREIESLIF